MEVVYIRVSLVTEPRVNWTSGLHAILAISLLTEHLVGARASVASESDMLQADRVAGSIPGEVIRFIN